MSLWASLAPPVGHMALRLCRLPDQSGSKVAARLEGLCVHFPVLIPGLPAKGCGP